MTPLIIMLMDIGQEPSIAVLIERLLATIVGCAIALTIGYFIWSKLTASPPSAVEPKAESESAID
jgi:uncharacterized membrane protein YccC